ncbi:hypothetical protein GCM10010531_19870 [Blastococcus jejuensis]|uniref:Uncharacterized protein n=1 Tax=Blastococcus jejuensis TaxID=351224 RepID=A0ABP6P4Q0_9ACTN
MLPGDDDGEHPALPVGGGHRGDHLGGRPPARLCPPGVEHDVGEDHEQQRDREQEASDRPVPQSRRHTAMVRRYRPVTSNFKDRGRVPAAPPPAGSVRPSLGVLRARAAWEERRSCHCS